MHVLHLLMVESANALFVPAREVGATNLQLRKNGIFLKRLGEQSIPPVR